MGERVGPTVDEAELAALLHVAYADLVRALGAGWRREVEAEDRDGVAWFVSGEPAQVSIGVQGPWFVLTRPATAWGVHRPGPLMSDEPRFTRDDVLHLADVVAEATEAIASRRRRSFRWCRTCRCVSAPEEFVGSTGRCRKCANALAHLES